MEAVQIFFFLIGAIAAIGLVQTYIIYPISLILLSVFKKKKHPVQSTLLTDESLPTVTIVCSAHNEEQVIQKKIENYLDIEYPKDKLFFLIGSDGSTDRTDEILSRYHNKHNITCKRFDRGGKQHTINQLMDGVQTDITVFTDANSFYDKKAIQVMVSHFVDPEIGGVCGHLHLIPSSESIGAFGEETYWEYETWLKKKEGYIYSTIGATGTVYSIRTALYKIQPIDKQLADDFLLPLRITAEGYRMIFDENAHVYEETTSSMKHEFRRKIRIAIGSFSTIPIINPLAFGFNWFVRYALLSHKYLRWCVPFFLIMILSSNMYFASSIHQLQWLLYFQIALYLLAAIGWIAELIHVRLSIFSLPFYFVAINTALLIAWFKLPFHTRNTYWTPTARK